MLPGHTVQQISSELLIREFATSTSDMIADAMVAALQAPTKFKPVEAEGAARAARMLRDLI